MCLWECCVYVCVWRAVYITVPLCGLCVWPYCALCVCLCLCACVCVCHLVVCVCGHIVSCVQARVTTLSLVDPQLRLLHYGAQLVQVALNLLIVLHILTGHQQLDLRDRKTTTKKKASCRELKTSLHYCACFYIAVFPV